MAVNKVAYSVGTSNKFAGFYDEGDASYYYPRGVPRTQKPFTPSGESLGSYRMPPRFPRVDSAQTFPEDVNDTRARGRRMSRRFRGNPNAPRRFDRVSGTGRGKELKKQGEGGHNWGNPSKESKTPNSVNQEETELTEELNNMNISEKAPSKTNEEKEPPKDQPSKDKQNERTKKDDVMDFESYKLLQQSKRTNLPTFTVNDKKNVSTDAELQNDGYVKYVKKTEVTKSQERVKVVNYNPGSNPMNLLPSHPSSFRDRRFRPKYPTQNKPRNTNNRIRVKAPDLTDMNTFPCLDLKS